MYIKVCKVKLTERGEQMESRAEGNPRKDGEIGIVIHEGRVFGEGMVWNRRMKKGGGK